MSTGVHEKPRYSVYSLMYSMAISGLIWLGVHRRDLMALTDTEIKALKPRKVRYLVTDGKGALFGSPEEWKAVMVVSISRQGQARKSRHWPITRSESQGRAK